MLNSPHPQNFVLTTSLYTLKHKYMYSCTQMDLSVHAHNTRTHAHSCTYIAYVCETVHRCLKETFAQMSERNICLTLVIDENVNKHTFVNAKCLTLVTDENVSIAAHHLENGRPKRGKISRFQCTKTSVFMRCDLPLAPLHLLT